MKKTSFILVVLFLICVQCIEAQSIEFTHPTNNMVVSSNGYGSTQTTIPVELSIYWENSHNLDLQEYYFKLFYAGGDQEGSPGNGINVWWDLAPGTYTWRIELWETYRGNGSFKVAQQTITFYVKHTLNVLNNFGGGNINIDNASKSSGSSVNKFTNENLALGAIDQSYNNYNMVWNQTGTNNSLWQKKLKEVSDYSPINGGTPRNLNYTVASNDNGAHIRADLRKICNINFQNSFPGGGSGGVISVNSSQYNSPTSNFQVVEANNISFAAVNQRL